MVAFSFRLQVDPGRRVKPAALSLFRPERSSCHRRHRLRQHFALSDDLIGVGGFPLTTLSFAGRTQSAISGQPFHLPLRVRGIKGVTKERSAISGQHPHPLPSQEE